MKFCHFNYNVSWCGVLWVHLVWNSLCFMDLNVSLISQVKEVFSCVLSLVTQLCLTLCDPMDFSPPGSSVHGDSPGKNTWSGLPCPPPGDLPNPGIEPRSPALQADSLPSEPPGSHLQICSLSLSLSLSSSIWGPNNVNINMLDVALSISSTILSFKILFSVQLEWFPLLCFPAHWSIPLYHLVHCWFFLVYFLFQLYSSALFSSSLCFLTLLNFSLCSSILLLSSLSIFIVVALNFLSGRLLISTSFSFSEVLSCSLIWTYSSVSSLCLILCFYFYVLYRSLMFPDLGEVALYRSHPMGAQQLYGLVLCCMWALWALLLWWGWLLWAYW